MGQQFNIVHCSLKEFNENFKKRKDVEIINYHDVMAKLENNDVYKNVPDRSIIEYYIIRRINHVLNSKRNGRIFYFLENLDLKIIQSLKKAISNNELEYRLVLIEDDDIDDIKREFDTIQILKSDDKA